MNVRERIGYGTRQRERRGYAGIYTEPQQRTVRRHYNPTTGAPTVHHDEEQDKVDAYISAVTGYEER